MKEVAKRVIFCTLMSLSVSIMTDKKEQIQSTSHKPKDPLHGVTLKNMLEDLVEYHGYTYLAEKVKIKVFAQNPTFNSSLKFLRKTPWAREKVEKLYIYHFVIRKEKERAAKKKK